MSKLSEIFGRRENESTEATTTPAIEPAAETHEQSAEPPREEVLNASKEILNESKKEESKKERRNDPLDEASGTRIGEEHEALRNLLVDAGMKVRQFDEYKTFINKLL